MKEMLSTSYMTIKSLNFLKTHLLRTSFNKYGKVNTITLISYLQLVVFTDFCLVIITADMMRRSN